MSSLQVETRSSGIGKTFAVREIAKRVVYVGYANLSPSESAGYLTRFLSFLMHV